MCHVKIIHTHRSHFVGFLILKCTFLHLCHNSMLCHYVSSSVQQWRYFPRMWASKEGNEKNEDLPSGSPWKSISKCMFQSDQLSFGACPSSPKRNLLVWACLFWWQSQHVYDWTQATIVFNGGWVWSHNNSSRDKLQSPWPLILQSSYSSVIFLGPGRWAAVPLIGSVKVLPDKQPFPVSKIRMLVYQRHVINS